MGVQPCDMWIYKMGEQKVTHEEVMSMIKDNEKKYQKKIEETIIQLKSQFISEISKEKVKLGDFISKHLNDFNERLKEIEDKLG